VSRVVAALIRGVRDMQMMMHKVTSNN
jgi:hypothetical protein